MLVLQSDLRNQLDASAYIVVVLQCLQNEVIGKEEAKNMLFINDIRAGK
jgi:hypothetical protein